jgi:hypothetical protein
MADMTNTATPETTTSNNTVAIATPTVASPAGATAQSLAATAHTSPRYHLAFESLKARLREMPADEYVPITVDVQSSVITVLGALPHIRQLRADFVQHLPTFDINLLDFMEAAAGALGYAQALYQTANEPLASIAGSVQTVRHWHGVLYNDACTLMARGALGATSLNNLKGANGNKNLAQDAMALVRTVQAALGNHLGDDHPIAGGTRPSTSRDRSAF